MTIMQRRYGWFWAGCIVAVVLPTTAWAHVKWFEDASLLPVRLDLVLSDRTYLWLGASTVALLWLSIAQRLLGSSWPDCGFLRRMGARAPTLLGIQAYLPGQCRRAAGAAVAQPGAAAIPAWIGVGRH